jgi:hypothetical protein
MHSYTLFGAVLALMTLTYVCFGSLADISALISYVRFAPESRHKVRDDVS